MARAASLLLPLVLLCLIAAVRFVDPWPVEWLRERVYRGYAALDLLDRADARRVRVVYLDAEAANHRDGTSPRAVLAEALTRIHRAGAAVAVLLVPPTPNRETRARAATGAATPSKKAAAARALSIAAAPDDTAALARAIGRGPTVIALAAPPPRPARVAPVRRAAEAKTRAARPAAKARIRDRPPLSAAFSRAAAIRPSPPMALTRAGRITLPLLAPAPGGAAPTAFLEALRIAKGAPDLRVRQSAGRRDAPVTSVRIGALEIPLEASAAVRVIGHLRDTRSLLPLSRLADSRMAAQLTGNIVLVAAGPDQTAPSTGAAVRAALRSASGLDRLLGGAAPRRPAIADCVELAALVGIGLLIGFIVFAAGSRLALLAVLGLALATVATAAWMFLWRGLLFDPATPLIAALIVLWATTISTTLIAPAHGRMSRRLLGLQLPKAVIRSFGTWAGRRRLLPRTEEAAVLVAELRLPGLAAPSADPGDLFAGINSVEDRMVEAVRAHGGALISYAGDRIVAAWNVPLAQNGYADEACAAARALDGAFRRGCDGANRGGHEWRLAAIGVGVAAGPVAVGLAGPRRARTLRLAGATVQRAGNLARYALACRTRLVIDQATAKKIEAGATFEIERVRMNDGADPQPVYVVAGPEAVSGRSAEGAREQALEELKAEHARLLDRVAARDWTGAMEALKACRSVSNGVLEGVYDLYAARIRARTRHPWSAAPPPGHASARRLAH